MMVELHPMTDTDYAWLPATPCTRGSGFLRAPQYATTNITR